MQTNFHHRLVSLDNSQLEHLISFIEISAQESNSLSPEKIIKLLSQEH